MQSYLDFVLSSLEDKIWKTIPLVRFLDNVAEKSCMVDLQLQYLAEQVRRVIYSSFFRILFYFNYSFDSLLFY